MFSLHNDLILPHQYDMDCIGFGALSHIHGMRSEQLENENTFTFLYDLPGVDKENVEITIRNRHLYVYARRKSKLVVGENVKFNMQYSDTMKLPRNCNTDSIVSKKLENGILTLVFNKMKVDENITRITL